MNELDLIKEIEKRPILYDKSVSGFNKTKLRDKAWKEVQEALNNTEGECKKRWRSLRDSYIKLQRTHGGRTRWPYVSVMKFLKPHVIEPKPDDAPVGGSDSDAEEEKSHSIQCLPDLSYIGDAYENNTSPQSSPKRAHANVANSSDDENSNCLCNRNDPDELFLISCLPILKRLNSKQNAVARLKIQQALYESEFGTQNPVELPCVTPANDCEGASQ